jgi:hypothetical protein
MADIKSDPWPWDVALNDVIGEICAEDALREIGVPSLKEPIAGLSGIFGVTKELRWRACRRLAQRLNRDPINVAARNWLPLDWRGDDGHLFVLTLMQWGLVEGGLQSPSYWETEDVAAGLIAGMKHWNPAFVMALLMNPERPEQSDEEASICADTLENAEDAETAAARLLDSLESAACNGVLFGLAED